MNRKLIIVGAAMAALSLAACGDKTETKGAATPAEQAATPDANPAATVPTAADETAAPDFIMKAAVSDMFEIEAGKLAAQRSTNAEVKKFANMMVEAHTMTSADLKSAIAASGDSALMAPTALDKDHQDKLDDLRKADAKDFDKKYADDMVDAHQAALNTLQRYAESGGVASLKAFAAATAPKVQEHLNMAEGLKNGMK
jgi:putative membrane protein